MLLKVDVNKEQGEGAEPGKYCPDRDVAYPEVPLMPLEELRGI